VPSPRRLERVFRFAERARHSAATVFLTDGAGGHAAPSPDPIAAEIARQMGRQPVVTVACKRSPRKALLTRLAALEAHGLRNVLIVSGDYPRDDVSATSLDSAFPLDSVSLLLAASRRAAGGAPPHGGAWLGAAVNPFKYSEAGVWGQRIKAWKKWRAGASFFVTQLGYDLRKLHEMRVWMARDGMDRVPSLASVYVLHAGTAGLLRGGRLPGTYLPPDLDPGPVDVKAPGARRPSATDLAVAYRRAALMADVAVRGLGCRGVLFGGVDDFDELETILETGRDLTARDWRESCEEYQSFPGSAGSPAPAAAPRALRFAPEPAFYLFPPSPDGLLEDGAPRAADRTAYARPPALLGLLHRLLFERRAPAGALLARLLLAAQRAGLGRYVAQIEHAVKRPLLGCDLCGDCRIAQLGYRCPAPGPGCPKGMLNGPCGGSSPDGWCEVIPARRCHWQGVVEGALATGDLAPLYLAQLPRDPALRGSSSWINHVAGSTPEPVALDSSATHHSAP
jgi:methylenetetrahydrofolate reductase (NADPH)